MNKPSPRQIRLVDLNSRLDQIVEFRDRPLDEYRKASADADYALRRKTYLNRGLGIGALAGGAAGLIGSVASGVDDGASTIMHGLAGAGLGGLVGGNIGVRVKRAKALPEDREKKAMNRLAYGAKMFSRRARLTDLNTKIDQVIEFGRGPDGRFGQREEEPSTLGKIGRGVAVAGAAAGAGYLGSAYVRGRSWQNRVLGDRAPGMFDRAGALGALKTGMKLNNRTLKRGAAKVGSLFARKPIAA